jgi:hypothetical protein
VGGSPLASSAASAAAISLAAFGPKSKKILVRSLWSTLSSSGSASKYFLTARSA